MVSAVKEKHTSAQGCGLIKEVEEGSPEKLRLDLPSGRLGDGKEGPCSWSAETRVARPSRLLRT